MVISFEGVDSEIPMLALTGSGTMPTPLRTEKSLAFVDPAPGHTAQRRKRPGMGVKQHLVALGAWAAEGRRRRKS